jgi:GNAT superfamily N-acetyltransferase
VTAENGPGRPAVRVASVGDADALVDLLAGGTLRGAEDPTDPGAYRRALEEIVATPGNDVLVAEVDGRVVGMCQLTVIRHIQEQGGRCAEIESMHVAAAHRGRGIGRVLLDAAVDRAGTAGCYRVQLTSNTVRTDAHRFYERAGFEPSHVGFKRYLSEPPG